MFIGFCCPCVGAYSSLLPFFLVLPNLLACNGSLIKDRIFKFFIMSFKLLPYIVITLFCTSSTTMYYKIFLSIIVLHIYYLPCNYSVAENVIFIRKQHYNDLEYQLARQEATNLGEFSILNQIVPKLQVLIEADVQICSISNVEYSRRHTNSSRT
jgi:hypothetical protein